MSELVNRFLPTFPRFASRLRDQSHVDTRIWRVFAVFLCKDSSHSEPNEDSCVRIFRNSDCILFSRHSISSMKAYHRITLLGLNSEAGQITLDKSHGTDSR